VESRSARAAHPSFGQRDGMIAELGRERGAEWDGWGNSSRLCGGFHAVSRPIGRRPWKEAEGQRGDPQSARDVRRNGSQASHVGSTGLWYVRSSAGASRDAGGIPRAAGASGRTPFQHEGGRWYQTARVQARRRLRGDEPVTRLEARSSRVRERPRSVQAVRRSGPRYGVTRAATRRRRYLVEPQLRGQEGRAVSPSRSSPRRRRGVPRDKTFSTAAREARPGASPGARG
jgi:hypothetical protein